jgi:hypothetical protein
MSIVDGSGRGSCAIRESVPPLLVFAEQHHLRFATLQEKRITVVAFPNRRVCRLRTQVCSTGIAVVAAVALVACTSTTKSGATSGADASKYSSSALNFSDGQRDAVLKKA